ncbi:hypothetical protein F7R91_34565 [Streptomyces luteolifulvus]|jgi:hypothetical protein|uniref:Uncharacterized protein n=1 Tax=Streptomyces luteolifulvus TaxID=2615112 RepID=A0A6H9UQT5_9ACTN|nr:hypothetical protein [Streptomyces luteolifulvus]KAB1140862.1 hypothetical protein F7R91_34565 [Streptomyces luteolifulvus]
MADSNGYIADPNRLRTAIRQIEEISEMARDIVRDFAGEVARTQGWPGRDDSFAREVLPSERKERESALETGENIAGAGEQIALSTLENLDNIEGTQLGALEGIQAELHRGRPGR